MFISLRIKILSVLCLNTVFSIFCYSQIGGQNTYEFLNFTNSARIASLGGNQISIKDNDLNFVLSNPSLLSASMDNNLVLNYVNYFSGINYGYVSYAKNLKKFGSVAAGLHTINYGKFIQADETGEITGQFFAAEYSLNLFWARAIDSLFSVGANVKPVLSVMEHYKSYGILSDVGITYNNSKRLFTASAVVKNIGSQIKPYVEGSYEPVGFDIQVGVTKKLKHAPFRLSFLAQHLQKFDLTYDNTNVINEIDTASGKTKKENKIKNVADKIMRHIVIGVEFMPSKNFYINLGFNYQRRKELVVSTRPFLTGFSAGFGLKISKFHFSYARASYHLAGASNFFSLSTNINELYKKSKI